MWISNQQSLAAPRRTCPGLASHRPQRRRREAALRGADVASPTHGHRLSVALRVAGRAPELLRAMGPRRVVPLQLRATAEARVRAQVPL